MLQITIPANYDLYDERKSEFIHIDTTELQLEHSLLSISKWESKWHTPFLSNDIQKTQEQIIDYVKCMTINKKVDPNVYYGLTTQNLKDINNYITDSHTATTFGKTNEQPGRRKVLTSELIYYYMTQMNIPFSCERWHINRLITLIRVYQEEQKPPKKKSTNEIMQHHAALNRARRAAGKYK